MALKTRIAKGDFDSLPDILKTEYIADGDGYKLDADYEDVTGLKNKNSELLEKLKGFKDFEGLNPTEVKAKLAALAEKENEDLAAKGKWEELEKKLRDKHAEESTALANKINALFAAQADKELQLSLIAAGVKDNLAEDLALSLRTRHIKHVEDGGKVVWKTLDDTETVDLATYIPKLKESKADYFKSDLAQGSGANGSGNSGASAPKQLTKAQVATLDPVAKREFYMGGGEVTDAA